MGPTAGSKYLVATYPKAGSPPVVVTFLFGRGVHAFGTDIRDVDNAAITYTTSASESGLAAVAAADGAVQFFVIISDVPLTSIAFAEPPAGTGGDAVVYDQTLLVPLLPRLLIADLDKSNAHFSITVDGMIPE